MTAETQSHSSDRVDRTFKATTAELADIVDVLMYVKDLLDSQIAAEERKLYGVRVSDVALDQMKARAAMLRRVVAEL